MLSIFFHSLSKKGHYPSSSSTPLLHPSHYHSPAIIHSHPTATGRWQYGDRGGDNPAMSSMVLPTVCEDLPEFSPIGGGEREGSPNVDERDRRRVCSKSLFPVTPCKNVSSFSLIKDLQYRSCDLNVGSCDPNVKSCDLNVWSCDPNGK